MTTVLREVVKKNGYFTNRLTVSIYTPPSLLWSAFCEILFAMFSILDYDSMCSEMDFTPEKSFPSNYKNSQFLFTAAAALSQNGQMVVKHRR